jgi:hypothetical protein
MKVVPLRLQPGVDLRLSLEGWMAQQREQAGCVISAVGSLSVAQLRLAGEQESTTAELVVGLLPEWRFSRELDPSTGHRELKITRQDLQ